ncbi:hypothetical protein AHAS_Ahas15G0001500 [Arachis hypogaea]
MCFRYRLHVITIDGTEYIDLIIWNQETKLVVGKSASEVKDLSDSSLESIFECGLETPDKGFMADSNAGNAISGVYSSELRALQPRQ